MNRVPRSSFIVHRSSFIVCVLFASCVERAVTTHDDLGRAVTLPNEIHRVVSLAPNLTEIVFALGAGDKLAGTDDFSNFPPPARALPKVGGMQPNVEKIAALKPDLIIASTEGNHPNLAQALEAAGIPLYVVRTDRLHEIEPAMRRLGELLHASGTNDAPRRLREDILRQSRKRERPLRILFAVWTDPLYVAGRNTFTDDLLRLTGAQNAVQVTGWPQYSLESLAASPPDLILYPRGAVTPQQMKVLMQRVPSLRAEVVPVDEDVFQRPGPRVVLAAAALNAILDARTR
ncbi:MAG TPA: ABC transporter substrate-binding protein [Thermoanaerobaculia bacterium]|nr:ABC transporter substrate-binding protein [Thermoanaerobaculia bacterium]